LILYSQLTKIGLIGGHQDYKQAGFNHGLPFNIWNY